MRQLANQSSALSRIAVALLFCAALSPLAAKASGCTGFLKAFNSYDELVDGKVEDRYSIFDLTEWSPHSAFEGILATDRVPSEANLTLEYRKSSKAKTSRKQASFETWSIDAKYRQAKLDPRAFLKEKFSGAYSVQVTANAKVLCEQTFEVTGGD